MPSVRFQHDLVGGSPEASSTAGAVGLQLRLLGPVEIVAGGRVLDIGGPRQRIVLAMLALNVNRVMPVERLIDAVWDDSPPSTARGQIQICISALRRVL